jgi:hypothetical protein
VLICLIQVDTLATPPRSIWTHPYEDEQYLSEHPEVREKLRNNDPPPSFEEATRRHSSHHPAESSTARHSSSDPYIAEQTKHKRGFFGKMKDKAIGTKEERMAARYREEEVCVCTVSMTQLLIDCPKYRRQVMESRRQQMYAQPQMYAAPGGYYEGNVGNRGRGMGGMGGMGMGLPLLGGLAGGLLLGDMLGGGFGDGGFGGGFDGGSGGGF